MRAAPTNWIPLIDALLAGKTIRIPDVLPNNVTGRISRHAKISGKWRVNVRTTPEGVVTWLSPKKEQR